MYVIHKSKPFYSTLTLLNIFFWYPRQNGQEYKIFFFSISTILRMISLLSACGTAAHIIIKFKDNTDTDISEDIGDLSGFVGCMSVCMTFMLYHTKWSNLFNNLLNFKNFGEPPKYQEVVKRGNFISLMCILYTIPGMLWYCFVSYLQTPECQEINTKKGLNEVCGMVNPTWLPSIAMKGNTFLVFYLFQTVGIFVYLPSAFAICILPWEAVEVIVARMDHLKSLLKNVFNSDSREQCIEQLNYFICYHQDILRICEELSGLVRSTIGSVFLTAAFVIGSLGSQLIKESTPKAFTFVMGYILALLFVCHAGQRLIDESLDIANHVYNSMWYIMDANIKKDVVFILARCQKPMCLAALPSMGSAGYLLFCIMIKTSYSYLTLLNQMV